MVPLKRKPYGAFSLLELVIVIVVIGIIAAVAIPRMSRGAAGAANSALIADLGIFRNAIELFGKRIAWIVHREPPGGHIRLIGEDANSAAEYAGAIA